MLKHLAIFAVLLAVVHTALPAHGQAGQRATDAPHSAGVELAQNTAGDGLSDHPQPHVTVVNPPALPAAEPAWPVYEKISWAASLILTLLAYVGITAALRTLKRIEQQAVSAEAASHAALECAQTASQYAQAYLRAERPWILISVEPSRDLKNHFKIMATNRGRTPAELFASSDRIGLAIDETYLPKVPEYASKESSLLPVPIILLPGESTPIQPFGREDVKWVCKTEESRRRVETWQDKIFIFGKVIYRDMIAPDEKRVHETDWCCRYIHGENSSDLVMTGPPEYNKHT